MSVEISTTKKFNETYQVDIHGYEAPDVLTRHERIAIAAQVIHEVKLFAFRYGIATKEFDPLRYYMYDYEEELPFNLDIKVEDDFVTVHWQEYIGCGEYETNTFKFPTSFLDNPEWEEIAVAEKISRAREEERKKRQEAQERRLEQQKKDQASREERDRKEYERLQKKFGKVEAVS